MHHPGRIPTRGRVYPLFSHQLSITSKTGVGSSTLLNGLKRALGESTFRFESGGSIMRAKAVELGMTIEQFAEHNRLHPEDGHDLACDAAIELLGRNNHRVVEGRIPHLFMPRACRVLLTCPPDVRADRRLKQEGLSDEHLAAVYDRIVKRDRDDDERYERLYPGCLWSEGEFDIIVRTDQVKESDTLEHVLRSWEQWRTKMKSFGMEFGPLVDSTEITRTASS